MNLITCGTSGRADAWAEAYAQASRLVDRVGMVGYGIAELFDGDGRLVQLSPFSNLITDAGDLYYATKMIAAIAPSSTAAPTAVNGMKLGTLAAAVGKAAVGAASLAASADYITGSNVAFDASFPAVNNLGTTLGVNATYKTTYVAGVATNAAIQSVVIVNDQATNATTTVANTISRAVITSVNKTASDTLAITWNHKALGA